MTRIFSNMTVTNEQYYNDFATESILATGKSLVPYDELKMGVQSYIQREKKQGFMCQLSFYSIAKLLSLHGKATANIRCAKSTVSCGQDYGDRDLHKPSTRSRSIDSNRTGPPSRVTKEKFLGFLFTSVILRVLKKGLDGLFHNSFWNR